MRDREVEELDDGKFLYHVDEGWWLFSCNGNRAHYIKDGKCLCGYQSQADVVRFDGGTHYARDYPQTRMDDDPWWHCKKCAKIKERSDKK